MAELLSPEAQAAADLNAGMQAAVAERDEKAMEALNKRGRELADKIASDREKAEKAAAKAAKEAAEA